MQPKPLTCPKNDDGLVVIDFKTDNVTPETVADRAKLYTEQITIYTNAAKKILNQTSATSYLYFLTPAILKPLDIECWLFNIVIPSHHSTALNWKNL